MIRGNKLSYFYYDDKLYKTLAIKRPLDELLAMRVKTGDSVYFSYADVLRNGERCWRISDIAKVLDLSVKTINAYIRQGYIPTPEYAHLGKTQKQGYMLREKDIANIIRYSAENPTGKSGPKKKVLKKTLAEVMLELNEGLVLYTKASDGQFVPVWSAQEW